MGMNCRICNRECQPLFQLDNMPDRNQHLSDKPDSKGITLNVVQCKGCGLVQLDNEPVWYWKESINSSFLSKDLRIPEDSVSFMELEHQPNPNEYLKEIVDGSIQVPNGAKFYYDFCIDHLMYFDVNGLQYALEYNGLFVRNCYIMPYGDIINADVKRYEHVAVYGAGHQAFAWLSQHPLFKVDCIIDDNPAKVDLYSPVTNIPIVTMSDADAIIVMAGGYSDEVLKKLDDFEGSVAVLRGNKLEVIR
jgi:hypothetical protein